MNYATIMKKFQNLHFARSIVLFLLCHLTSYGGAGKLFLKLVRQQVVKLFHEDVNTHFIVSVMKATSSSVLQTLSVGSVLLLNILWKIFTHSLFYFPIQFLVKIFE